MDMEGGEVTEDDGGGGEAEGDIVGQRVELLSDGRGNVEQTGHHTVEEVEDSPYDDEQQRQIINPHEGEISGDAA